MASFTINTFFTVQLKSDEVALIIKALGRLKNGSGEPLAAAQELRDAMLRQRAKQSLQMAEKAAEVLATLPPEDHDYYANEKGSEGL